MQSNRIGAFLFGTAAILALVSAAHARSGDAQSAAAAQPAASSSAKTSASTAAEKKASGGSIETVVVTAERRAEDIQRVPISMSALSGDSLDKLGIIGFQDLGTRVPSLRFATNPTGGENVITMRGFGSVNVTNGGDSPVAYSLDGVTLQRSTAVDPEFYDVDRIELLRGPQGTLYGRNSVGGSINVITNHPTDTLSAGVDAEIGDYASRIFRGYANAPVVNDGDFQVNVRITGVSAQHSGYTTNVSTDPLATHNLDSQDLLELRGQIDVRFSSNTDLLLMATTLDNKGPTASKVQFWQTPQRYGGETFLTNPRKISNNYPDNQEIKVNLYTATLNSNLGWAEFTSITGYETSDNSATNDEDGSNLQLAYEPFWQLKQAQLSEELRLTSKDDQAALRWVVGLYYFWASNYENFAFIDTGKNSIPPGSQFETFYSNGILKARSWAPFGQVDYDLAKTALQIPLTITAGVRFSNDHKYGSGILFFDGFPVPTGPQNKTWSQWTGKFGLAYQFNDDIMGYASISRGYLSGGDIIGLAKVYNPEHVWSYEVGEKASLLDNHLQLNVSAYWEDIANMQVFIQNGTESGIDNAAKARVRGLEAEAIAIPIDGLRVNLGLAVTDAKYLKYDTKDTRYGYTPPTCKPAPGGTCDFSGHHLNQTPPYTVNLGAEYAWETSIGTITPRVDIFWSGRVDFVPDNLSHQSPYHTTDIHLIWTDRTDTYRLDAFVRNLENNDIISLDAPNSLTLGGTANQEPDDYSYYPPRTVGIRFGVKI
jgi:iron complex outermembrane recepter protein